MKKNHVPEINPRRAKRRQGPAILSAAHWDSQYRVGHLPWETGRPSGELRRVLGRGGWRFVRVIELGCGTGVNAVWMAQQGLQVTAVDLSPLAIKQARHRAWAAGVAVRFLTANLLDACRLGGPYDFFFDRGCYHAVRRVDAQGYVRTLESVTRSSSWGLVLAGNADEPEDPIGPPVVTRGVIEEELGHSFNIVHLRAFRFDHAPGYPRRYLGWSCLLRRRRRPGSERG